MICSRDPWSNYQLGRGGNQYRGRGRGRGGPQSYVRCQICFRYGHSAMTCYQRYEPPQEQPSPQRPPHINNPPPHTMDNINDLRNLNLSSDRVYDGASCSKSPIAKTKKWVLRSSCSSMTDGAEPRSLFVVVSWDYYTTPNFSCILQLEAQGRNNQTQVIDTDFSLIFCRPKPLPKNPVPYIWAYSPLESCDEAELCMVPDWSYRPYKEDDVPLRGYILNLRTKKWKHIKPSLAPKYHGRVVNHGGYIYFMEQPLAGRTPPDPAFERYNPLNDEWEKLKPFPRYAIESVWPLNGTIVATAVWEDTILFNMFSTDIWAYNTAKDKWYPVDVGNDCRCIDIIGETVVLGNTIYALTDGRYGHKLSAPPCNLILALSIERREDIDDDRVYKCSVVSEILVPGMDSIQFQQQEPRPMHRHLVYLGQDNLCLVQSCQHSGFDDNQHIQVTNIKLNNGDKSMTVTNTRIHRFHLVEKNQFHVNCCFSLPDRKIRDFKKAKTTFEFNPFPDGYFSKRA